jgi:hypothetical protein
LIGVFISSATQQASIIQDAKPNTSLEALGLGIQLKNFTIYNGTGSVYSDVAGRNIPEHSALRMDVVIEQGDNTYHRALWIRLYTLSGVVSTPMIITTWAGDMYIHMHQTESMYDSLVQALIDRAVMPEDLILVVEVIPMVYLVWAGVALICTGMALPLVKELAKTVRQKDLAD